MSSVHGQWRARSSTLSAQVYAYDQAGRLTTVRDTFAGACTTRVYAFAGTSGKASNRTSLTTFDSDAEGACQTTTAVSARAYTYDEADRITTAGTVYDALGRTTTTPAVDTNDPDAGDVTMTYYTTDMARSIEQNGRTTTHTVDVIGNRYRSWTDADATTTVTKTNHYGDDGDSPVWTDEGSSVWTRIVAGPAGVAAIETGPTSGVYTWQITNLHGDFIAGYDSGPGLTYTSEYTEYGGTRDLDRADDRYGWLGAEQRPADTPSGITLMGVRLYSQSTGRFLSADPVSGGNANSYVYPTDPVNMSDVDGRIWKWVAERGLNLLTSWLPAIACKFAGLGAMLCGAVVGAVMGGISYYVITKFVYHRQFSWSALGAAVLDGAIGGALGGKYAGKIRSAIGAAMRFIRSRLNRLGFGAAAGVLVIIENLLLSANEKKVSPGHVVHHDW